MRACQVAAQPGPREDGHAGLQQGLDRPALPAHRRAAAQSVRLRLVLRESRRGQCTFSLYRLDWTKSVSIGDSASVCDDSDYKYYIVHRTINIVNTTFHPNY